MTRKLTNKLYRLSRCLRAWTLSHHTIYTYERKSDHARSKIYLKRHKTILLWLYRNKTQQFQLLRVKEWNTVAFSLSNMVVVKSLYQQLTPWYTSDHQSLRKKILCCKKSPTALKKLQPTSIGKCCEFIIATNIVIRSKR